MVFALGIDADAGGCKLPEQLIQVVDAKVDHGLLRPSPKYSQEMCEDSHARRLRPAESQRSVALRSDPKMLCRLPLLFPSLLFLLQDLLQLGFVFGLPAGSRRVHDNARRLGLSHTFAGIRLDGFRR